MVGNEDEQGEMDIKRRRKKVMGRKGRERKKSYGKIEERKEEKITKKRQNICI